MEKYYSKGKDNIVKANVYSTIFHEWFIHLIEEMFIDQHATPSQIINASSSKSLDFNVKVDPVTKIKDNIAY